MELTDLRQIRQGISGAQAADIINNNDITLYNAIQEVKEKVDTNEIIAKNVQDTGETIYITSETGDSTNKVMTQSAVTREFNIIEEELSDACYIKEEDVATASVSGSMLTYASVSEKAATDIKGRSIANMIDAFESYRTSANNTISGLTERIEILEEPNNQKISELEEQIAKDKEEIEQLKARIEELEAEKENKEE